MENRMLWPECCGIVPNKASANVRVLSRPVVQIQCTWHRATEMNYF